MWFQICQAIWQIGKRQRCKAMVRVPVTAPVGLIYGPECASAVEVRFAAISARSRVIVAKASRSFK
jgi:hypothetical protein